MSAHSMLTAERHSNMTGDFSAFMVSVENRGLRGFEEVLFLNTCVRIDLYFDCRGRAALTTRLRDPMAWMNNT